MELMLAVPRASWSSEGHLGAQIGSDSAASANCTGPDGAQQARAGGTNGFTEPNLTPKRSPRGFKLGPRGAQESPKSAKLGPS